MRNYQDDNIENGDVIAERRQGLFDKHEEDESEYDVFCKCDRCGGMIVYGSDYYEMGNGLVFCDECIIVKEAKR